MAPHMGVLKHFPSGDKYKQRILKSKLQPRKEVVSFRSRMDNNLNGKSSGPQTGVLTQFPTVEDTPKTPKNAYLGVSKLIF